IEAPPEPPQDDPERPTVPGFQWVYGDFPGLPWRLWRLHCSWRQERREALDWIHEQWWRQPPSMIVSAAMVIVETPDERLEIGARQVRYEGEESAEDQIAQVVRGVTGWTLYDAEQGRMFREPVVCARCETHYEADGGAPRCPTCGGLLISGLG
ncbi:MAG: hypothetical protein AAFV53_34850, partial [Myxococcota bacterium]